MLVGDFVQYFNEHRMSTVIPSSLLCVGESISRCYELEGSWINIGNSFNRAGTRGVAQQLSSSNNFLIVGQANQEQQ